MSEKMSHTEAKAYVDELYKKVAKRWKEKITDSPFMEQLRSGVCPPRSGRVRGRSRAK